MKNKNFLISTLGVAAVATTLLLFPFNSTEGVYQSRVDNDLNKSESIDEAFALYEMFRKNVETGLVNPEDALRARAEVQLLIDKGDRADVSFKDHGPDNVGGRTRAILIDKDDVNHVFAGSVTGGLFVSTNRGSTWNKVEGYDANYSISSMCQTDDGIIYVGTGHQEEADNGIIGTTQNSGLKGNGVYASNDNGVTFTQVDGTENYEYVDQLVAKGNICLIAVPGSSGGLMAYENGTITDFASINGGCSSVSISPDGEVIVGAFSTQKTYVSEDGGDNFTPVYGNGANEVPSSKQRAEYAVSHEKVNGKYIVYASMSQSGSLAGVWRSEDNGMNWAEIAPANNGTPGSFAPFGDNSQGGYDQILTVVKGDPNTCLLGGIDVHAKSLVGNWEVRSGGFFGQTSDLYVHSDQHEMQWDSEGRLWLGNDGGVFYSDDNGNTFRESNRGYNVTQFYRISASAHGDVMGGAQDNGTQANYHDNHTYQEHDRVNTGDGYACDFSFMNRDIIFSTIYFGAFYRSGDRGFNTSPLTMENIDFGTPSEDRGSFFTVGELYENPNDLNSTDSVAFTPSKNYFIGDTIEVASMTSQQHMTHILTEDLTFQDSLFANPGLTIQDIVIYYDSLNTLNLYDLTVIFISGMAPVSAGDTIDIDGTVYNVDSTMLQDHYFGTNVNEPGEVVDMGDIDLLSNVAWDTIVVQDVFQSWYVAGFGAGGGIWMSRNALRFAATRDGFLKAGGGISGTVTELEFSKDGKYLYVGSSNGRLYRLSGIDSIYSPNPQLGSAAGNLEDSLLNWDHPNNVGTDFELIGSFAGAVTGITVEKGDAGHVVVSLGGYGGAAKIYESNNAIDSDASNVSFGSIQSNLPLMPCLSVVMDRDNSNVLFVGTDFGLYRSENGGGTWDYCDAPFGLTPIFDLKQNWRTWDEGCYKPGEIYVGTHGRGIWSTSEYLSVEEPIDNVLVKEELSDLLIFPNPAVNNVNVNFSSKIETSSTIKVYSLTGKLVLEMNNVNLTIGENNINLGIENLSNGTYIVQLSSDSISKTTKFIKQ